MASHLKKGVLFLKCPVYQVCSIFYHTAISIIFTSFKWIFQVNRSWKTFSNKYIIVVLKRDTLVWYAIYNPIIRIRHKVIRPGWILLIFPSKQKVSHTYRDFDYGSTSLNPIVLFKYLWIYLPEHKKYLCALNSFIYRFRKTSCQNIIC